MCALPATSAVIGPLYCSRTTTLSVAPLASITVSRTKPGPSGERTACASRWRFSERHAVDQHGERLAAAGDLQRERIDRAGLGGELEPRAVRREHDLERRLAALARQAGRGGSAAAAAAAWRWWRSACRAARAGSGASDLARAREGIEQDRRRGGAADQARHRRAVGPADPDADGALAVEADRPGVAIAVGLVPVLNAMRPPGAFSGGGVPSRMLPTYQAATGSISRRAASLRARSAASRPASAR